MGYLRSLLTNYGVPTSVQPQRSDDGVHTCQLVILGHCAGQPQHCCKVEDLMHGQLLVQQVILYPRITVD